MMRSLYSMKKNLFARPTTDWTELFATDSEILLEAVSNTL